MSKDIIGTGDFGRDDGVLCDDCGGKTYLIDDQGGGLCGYTCEVCDATFQVQYEMDAEWIDFGGGDEYDGLGEWPYFGRSEDEIEVT